LSDIEKQLKWGSYEQLQQLLKDRRFARAIALVEGLAQRLPQDPEVRQWQAIAYSSWGRHLVNERQLDKARIYLKKALRTDPHNRSLWAEVERDFRRMEQIL
jgi:tetratricopeptide (TPR) repeat protein